MRIKSIKLENIRSHKKTFIEFPVGSILLSGDIGSGKSTILSAIEFCLFGVQKGEVEGRSLLRHNAEHGSVELELDINNSLIKVTRSLRRKNKAINQDSCSISFNNNKEELSPTELRAKIFNLLNYPQSNKKSLIYRFTVYTPQEEMKRILLEKADIRVDVLRKLFNIDKYSRLKENVKILHDYLREKISEWTGQVSDVEDIKKQMEEKNNEAHIINKNISVVSIKLNKLTKEEETLTQKLKQNEEKSRAALKIISEMGANINLIEDKKMILKRLRLSIEELKQKKATLKKSVDNQITNLKINLVNNNTTVGLEQLKEEMEKLKDSQSHLETQFDDVEKKRSKLVSDYNALLMRVNDLQSEKKSILEINVCPRCKQKVSEQHKQTIIKEVEEKITQLDKIAKQKKLNADESDKIINKLKQDIKLNKDNIMNMEKLGLYISSLNETIANIMKVNDEAEIISKDIDRLIKQADMSKLEQQKREMENLNLEIKLLQEKLETVRHDKMGIVKEESSFKSKEQMLRQDILDLQQKLKNKGFIRKKLEKLKSFDEFIMKEFTQILGRVEKLIMITINKEFDYFFKRWFSVLVPDEEISVRLDFDFTPVVEQNGVETVYNYLSGGEKTALALAYRLALNQTINNLISIATKGLIILDEPTDGFSERQLDRMKDILQEVKTEQTIIVSHEPKIENFVDNIIKLKKEDGKTIINTV